VSASGNGLAGVFLTVVLTATLVVLSGFLFYIYLLHIHMNGRFVAWAGGWAGKRAGAEARRSMLDVHFRLHGEESSFLVPDDMEISLRTLTWIINKCAVAPRSAPSPARLV
jgi:hypothetical protein